MRYEREGGLSGGATEESLARAATEVAASSVHIGHSQDLVVCSPRMRELYGMVQCAAKTSLPVLILGETGSGKELVARAVHGHSPRASGAFRALNCATIPPQLTESVLFGHERGSFTGAERQMPGVFEQARGGSVFLDEVGELPLHAQAALLRVLEQRCVVRVGGSREIEVDVRVIAATHRRLDAMVTSGGFREDLLYRLDAFRLNLPPLRERREEVMPLAELFLKNVRQQWPSGAQRFSSQAMTALIQHDWPGNVRQLKNVVERAASVCPGEQIDAEHLPEHIAVPPSSRAPAELSPGFVSLPERLRLVEIGLIRDALVKTSGNQTRAARMLGVPRRTLANKVRVYGLGAVNGNGEEAS